MTLTENLRENLRRSLKTGDKDLVLLLRFLLAQIHNEEIRKHGQGQEAKLSDEEVIEVLRKELKKRKEAADLYRKGQREDLAVYEEKESDLISQYLPTIMNRQEVEAVIDELIANGLGEFGSLMSEAMKRLRGRADGHLVSEVVKAKLVSL